jgi:hypothetical protein
VKRNVKWRLEAHWKCVYCYSLEENAFQSGALFMGRFMEPRCSSVVTLAAISFGRKHGSLDSISILSTGVGLRRARHFCVSWPPWLLWGGWMRRRWIGYSSTDERYWNALDVLCKSMIFRLKEIPSKVYAVQLFPEITFGCLNCFKLSHFDVTLSTRKRNDWA